MKQPITRFHKDLQDDWFVELLCGHFQHLRHRPPWENRPWIESELGRQNMLGYQLECKKCDQGAAPDTLDT
ncbi:DUF3565 domain-containing protein [Parahaliea sp. F7430]|uniref:DUF3565 domain-containing protein n=1 Tax=Sediminihaliea albiluteola TaxID=2758564 RepID=A0A7W2TUF9_9GAMM|nr:DUF3565 domain-containing protein [Sediminihaliea albiluteola]MBA6412156.1 DUF3565 domain-containing protein [Sediminihaliea albiluteola]